MVDCGWRENTEVRGGRKAFPSGNRSTTQSRNPSESDSRRTANQGILVNLTVAELLNELPAFNGTSSLRVQNSPQFGTYSEEMNPVYTQGLEIYFSISHLPMPIPVVFVSSFHFFRLKFVIYLAPPLWVLCSV
jgi:hypothetical protein